MALGRNIRLLREARGLSQVDLAKKAGIGDHRAISALEVRDSVRSQFTLQIAKALEVPPELLQDTEDEVLAWIAADRKIATSPVNQALSAAIHAALPVVLDAIAMCPHRDELRTLLALLVDHDAPAYRQRLAELLGSFDPRGPNLTPKDMELAERVKKAARAAESFDVVGTLKQQVKT
ncbi:helix-turn-helix domain-containing protein [Tepidimonas charontis]|uniref:Transcriptional regulator, y4mF family n=1 Tax=Tepidimonas charontis TaxID=2267262 RepID=A0A554X8C9_9BURK|nr:helix-turn-helix transcriptional regulator [Tepidimonas charontis]TSE32080.1 transcriptional regulator, y4mF family [Tepidimonas charontis]